MQNHPDQSGHIAELQARIKDLEATLNQKDQDLALAFKLTPTLSDVFGLLLSLPVVTPEMIHQRLELTAEPRVTMHRLRQHMKTYGVEIESRRHIGYWLEEETKQKVRRRVAATLHVQPAEDDDEPVTPEVNGAHDQGAAA